MRHSTIEKKIEKKRDTRCKTEYSFIKTTCNPDDTILVPKNI